MFGLGTLYLRDVPIYYGLENTIERLENIEKPIWALNLSGGSARAFAHIGVLKKLEEEGLRPNAIITNSMGSIVGLAYAAGMSIDDIEDMVKTLKFSEFFELVFPAKGGFLDIHRFEALMYSIFGDMDISETPIPVFVVAEDLNSKRQVILSKGNLVKVLKASFALPFYFEPVDIEDFRLVDGGTSALVPILPFTKLLPNMVVSSTFYAAEVNLNNPITILNVTLDISKSRRSVKQIKEFKPFLIRCDVEDISFMAFNEGEKIINKGYESCSKSLSSLNIYLENRGISPSRERLTAFESTKGLHENWINVKTRLHQTPLPVKEPGWSIHPGLESWHLFGNPHYLNQNYFLVLKTSLWFERNLIEGTVFSNDKSTGPMMRLELGINNSLYIDIEAQLNFSTQSENLFQYDSNYIYSRAGAILPIFKSFVEPGLFVEFKDIEDPKKLEYFLRPGVNWKSGSSNIELDFRYLIRQTGENNITGISAEYKSFIPVVNNFGLETRAFAKGAFDGLSTGVELTFNDYFRSIYSAILSGENLYFPSYLILNNSMTWDFGSHMPGLGELITLESSNIYLFSDLLFTDIFKFKGSMGINPTMGLGLSLETSLLGLKPYIFNFSTGWDINAKSPFITFNLETTLN
jgi:predicted acylesterase/phospholipase RssA